jgi:uncharacterized protein YjbI with pentapeptide repeats
MTGADISHANMRSAVMAGVVMDDTEKQGVDFRQIITEKDMGDKLENLGKSLPELLEEHTIWVATAGGRGRQLDLSDYDLRDVMDLRKFPLTAICAMNANFMSQDLTQAELQSGVFDRADFRDCKFSGADLRGSTFKYANLSRADLSGAKMCPLEFKRENGTTRVQRVNLSGANMKYVSLRDADLRDCVMMGVDLSHAVLTNCDLRRADLTGAILNGTILENVKLDGTVIDLSAVS